MQPEDLERSVDAAQAFLRNQDAAGRSGGAGFARRHAQRRPGLYRRQERAHQRGGRLQRNRGPGICAGRELEHQPDGRHHRLHARRERVQRPQYRPRALRAARPSRKSLAKINEKKSLLYFSGGISRDGIENEASLRSAINAAVRADLAIYSVDTRGLQAVGAAGRRLYRQPARAGRIQRRRAHEQHERRTSPRRK